MPFPDFSRCSVNLVSSLGAFFGLDMPHPGLPELDAFLAPKVRGVVLLVLDGLGSAALDAFLPEGSFLRSTKLCDLSAVFPPTTVAATPSLRSGLFPLEHGWLGWTMFYPQLGKNVDVFSNKVQFTGEAAAPFQASERYLPYPQVTARLKDEGLARGYAVSPYDEVPARSFDELETQLLRLSALPGRFYAYAYNHQPDAAMHEFGVRSREAQQKVLEAEARVGRLAGLLPKDVLLLVTADHGLVDTVPLVMEDFPVISGMLSRPLFLEPRAAALSVKPEAAAHFPAAFQEAFGDDFLLLSRRELLENGLLGPGKAREGLAQYLGDYLAVALRDKALYTRREDSRLIGMHAGLTRDELRVPLIVARQ